RARRLYRAGVLDLAVGPDGSLPGLAAADCGADFERTSGAGQFAATAGGMRPPSKELPPQRNVFPAKAALVRELLMSSIDSEIRNMTDKATYERLEKDVTAVKNDIA